MNDLDGTPEGRLDVNYADVRDSFGLAMQNAGIDPETRLEILRTVDDYVDNHYAERLTTREE